MGGKQGKELVINADTYVPAQGGQSQALEAECREVFNRSAVNGNITKDRFHESLLILEKNTALRLRDTPLAEKMFFYLDQDNNGLISESEFVRGISDFIRDPDLRIRITFMAYDKDNDKVIRPREFIEFIEESWKCAFRCLGNKVEKSGNRYNMSAAKIERWATQNRETVLQEAEKLFREIDRQSRGYLDFATFQVWCRTTDVTTVVATFDNEVMEIPLSLYKLERQ
eukprot:TRINITY_DN11769_c0_g1_i3.p1 TRINITY_DN11769_c0_g1~~TRINITY_DN11769_c0_g1_i3.p1  ORF type:complete len:227 (+),score=65.22 TRINITY_DN11769_c0_g1_i3:72-752(+)